MKRRWAHYSGLVCGQSDRAAAAQYGTIKNKEKKGARLDFDGRGTYTMYPCQRDMAAHRLDFGLTLAAPA